MNIKEKKEKIEFEVTLKNDYLFKRLLGAEDNKAILQNFLECVLKEPLIKARRAFNSGSSLLSQVAVSYGYTATYRKIEDL